MKYKADKHIPIVIRKCVIKSPTREYGFSLIEVMVALLLSLMIMIGIIQIFISSSNTHRATEGLSRAQENGRFAIDFLTREIRMAGHMGCLGNATIFNNLGKFGNDQDDQFDPTLSVKGFEADNTEPGGAAVIGVANPANGDTTWTPALNTSLVPGSGGIAGAIPGTDAIVIYRLDSGILSLVAPQYMNNANLFVAPNSGIQKGDVMMVTDCEKASLFQVTSTNNSGATILHAASGSPGNDCSAWGGNNCAEQTYGPDAELAKLVTSAFYIASGASGKPALFLASLQTSGGAGPPNSNMAGQELVDGIENMQILYGVDATATILPVNASIYETAAQVTARDALTPGSGWARVISVRVSVVASSQNINGSAGIDTEIDTNTYLLTGVTAATATTYVPVGDGNRRRVFSATIQLRNRGR